MQDKEEHIPDHDKVITGAYICLFFEWLLRELPPGHWFGDVLKVIFHQDAGAAERLVDNFYTKRELIHIKRQWLFKFWMNKRLMERGYHGGLRGYVRIWKETAIPSLIVALSPSLDQGESELEGVYFLFEAFVLSLKDDSFLAEFNTRIHQILRNAIRKEIEFDLTDGATLDQKEIMNISGDDKGEKPKRERDPEHALDWMKWKMEPYIHFGQNIEDDSENLNVDFPINKLLDDVLYADKLILLCPPGEFSDLSRRLDRTENALYVRKNTLIKQLIKKTKSPPKILQA